jgi:replicative DNA helicase
MKSNNKKQKYLIESLLSSKDVFSRCISIIKSHYFEKNYERVIKFMSEYYTKYSGLPTIEVIESEFDISFKKRKITKDEITYVCDEIEKFCKEEAVKNAILESNKDMQEQNYGAILERMTQAVTISLDRDMGIEFFENPEKRLKELLETQTPEPLGIDAIDKHLNGGIVRKELTLFSANSGGGKSIMMNNIGARFAHKGMKVLYVSLELTTDKVFLRTSSMWSNIEINSWKENIREISESIIENNVNGGSFRIKRLPQQSCANDIRAYLKHYELQYDCVPDMLIVDYLDLMSPNNGGKNMSISERDKFSSEELVEILHDYDMYGISASQQNRDAIGNSAPDQRIIAGGMTKINTTDNYISLYMDEGMRLQGIMMAYFLKTRSSSGVGHSEELAFHSNTLSITDKDKSSLLSVMPIPKSKRLGNKEKSLSALPSSSDDENGQTDEFTKKIEYINTIEDEDNKTSIKQGKSKKSKKSKKDNNFDLTDYKNSNELLNYMKTL